LNEQLECAFEGIGAQVGNLIRCLVKQEVESHLARIQQLQSILDGNVCTTTISNDGENPTT
jgi:hypothetical protein